MESREDYKWAEFHERRKSYLDDMDINALEWLIPEELQENYSEIKNYYVALYGEDYACNEYRKEIIEFIMDNYLDKQVNPELT